MIRDRIQCSACGGPWRETDPGAYVSQCSCAAGATLTTPRGASMLRRTATAIATALLAVAALVVGVWLAAIGRRGPTPHRHPTDTPPPSLDDERGEVVADVDTMDRDAVVEALREGGY